MTSGRFFRALSLASGAFALGVLVLFPLGCAESPDQGRDLVNAAREAYTAGRYLDAEDMYQSYLQEHPHGGDRLEAWKRLYDVATSVREDQPRAGAILDALLLEFSSDTAVLVSVLSQAAQNAEARRDWEKARDMWRDYLNISGLQAVSVIEGRVGLARVYVHLKDPVRALTELDSCLDANLPMPDAGLCRLEKGRVLARMGREKESLAAFRSLYEDPVALPGQRAEAGFALAEDHEKKGESDQARAMYQSIKNDYPNPRVIDMRLRKRGK